ncbi:MAG: hypothetical protein JAY60_18550 [Candidatus Thiodiazotropha weberae]|nr:hypothetical protein [Candidatus Thiodiazotropha weberae]
MATGRIGAVDLAAATYNIVATATSGTVTVANVNICNRNSASVRVRLAIEDGSSGTPADEDFIEYDYNLAGNGVLERTGLVLAAGHSIVAYSDTANVSVQAWAIEESA